jgi:hypothetical protein
MVDQVEILNLLCISEEFIEMVDLFPEALVNYRVLDHFLIRRKFDAFMLAPCT